MKRCIDCGAKKDLADFGQYRRYCKECGRGRRRASEAADPDRRERRKARDREYYKRNREEVNAKNRQWYEANRERSLAYAKRYREENAEQIREQRRQFRQGTKREQRDVQLRWHYGITLSDYERMFEQQEGRCAICQRESEVTMHVDHDHEKGKVRGLLCPSCNLGLGKFDDSIERLEAALVYLRRSERTLARV